MLKVTESEKLALSKTDLQQDYRLQTIQGHFIGFVPRACMVSEINKTWKLTSSPHSVT